MAFYYGLVSQRGPWRETEYDILRLTTPYQPQFIQGIENVNTNLITHPVPGSTRDGVGSELPDISPFNGIGNPINGVGNTLGITEQYALAFAQKVSSPEFTTGSDGQGATGLLQAAEILQQLQESNVFPWTGNLTPMLNQRFENLKNTMRLEDIQLLNTVINGEAFSPEQITAIKVMEQLENNNIANYTLTAEEARAKVLQTFPNQAEKYLVYKNGGQIISDDPFY